MQLNISSVSKFAAVAVLAASAGSAFAQSAGSMMFSAGWFHVAPQDSSTPLTLIQPALGAVPGSSAGVKNVDTLGMSLSYFITDNWSASFDFGIPPKYSLYGGGSLAPIGKIGTAKQWAPALVGKYNFGTANTQLRPYLGLGVTRVTYKSISLTDSLQAFEKNNFGPAAVTTAALSSTWAPVFTGGLSYAITKDWFATFSVSYVRLKTDATLTSAPTLLPGAIPAISTAKLTLNPIVTYLNVGYRF